MGLLAVFAAMILLVFLASEAAQTWLEAMLL